jgi:hypothetical protein
MPTAKRSPAKLSSEDAKALRNAKRYIANLKKWLKREHQWQIRVRRDFRKLHSFAHKGGGGPTVPPPPPKPPFSP